MPMQQHLKDPDTTSKEGKKVDSLIITLGAALESKYRTYKGARFDKEREWERAIKQYDGAWADEDMEKIERALRARGDNQDPITVNITRPKTNAAIARMKDIQFPTGGDFNFGIKPAPLTQEIKEALKQDSPSPEMQQEAEAAGVPPDQLPSPAEMAQEVVVENQDNAPQMERALRNRMIYADYGRKARHAIEDLGILGTACVKGPTIQNRKDRRYAPADTKGGKSIHLLTEQFIPEPNLERVDPLFLFPDPSARFPDEIEDLFELHASTRSEMIALAKNPAFMPEQIKRILMNEPDQTHIPDIIRSTSRELGEQGVNNRFWIREYHGPIDKQCLFDAEMISEKDFEDTLKQFNGEVWLCDGIVFRISLSHIEGEDSLPYGIANWERDPNSVFGHGVPFLLRNAQRVVNNAYLMLLDNASLTSGPQIVINKEMIEPANKSDYGIEPMKVWFMTEYGSDVREAMQFVDIPAQMQGISQIIDTAMQFADVEGSTPLMNQEQTPVGNNTTTGMSMVMSASNVVQKAASLNWDDYITRPMVQRFYHYEMQYGEDAEIKGDYEIQVGGATERIEAEIRAQEIERMMGLASSNEEFMNHVDSNKAFRALVDNTRTGDLLRTQDEVDEMVQQQQEAAQAEQQEDPNAIKAQAAMIEAQATAERVKLESQDRQAKNQEMMQAAELRYAGESQLAQSRMKEAESNYQLGMAKLALEQGKTVAQIEKDMALGQMNFKMELMLKEKDFEAMEREIEVKNIHGTGI